MVTFSLSFLIQHIILLIFRSHVKEVHDISTNFLFRDFVNECDLIILSLSFSYSHNTISTLYVGNHQELMLLQGYITNIFILHFLTCNYIPIPTGILRIRLFFEICEDAITNFVAGKVSNHKLHHTMLPQQQNCGGQLPQLHQTMIANTTISCIRTHGVTTTTTTTII